MEKQKLITQLRRIEGQVRGIASMIEGERGLVPTVQQLMAAQSSLRKVTEAYIALFLHTTDEGSVELTPDQVQYLLKLIRS